MTDEVFRQMIDCEMFCGMMGTYVWKDEDGEVHVRALSVIECLEFKNKIGTTEMPEGVTMTITNKPPPKI